MTNRDQILLIARQELKTMLFSRGFLAASGLIVVLIITLFSISGLFPSDPLRLGLVGEQPAGAVETLTITGEFEPDELEVVQLPPSTDPGDAIEAENLDAIVVDGSEIIVSERDTETVGLINTAWSGARVVEQLQISGVDNRSLSEVLSPLAVTELDPDSDRDVRQASSFITVLLLFVAVQISGGFIMMGIMEEKGTKIVELLLSSIHPRNLLVGKVIGIGAVGLIQVVVMVAAVIAGALVSGLEIPALQVSTVALSLMFFLVGFLFYGSLFAAGASLAPRQQDAQATLAPVTIIMMMSYFVTFATAASPNSAVARWLSLFPSISPFAIPSRLAAGESSVIEAILALVVAVVVTAAVFSLAARVYVRSVIHTDRKLGWLEAWNLTS